MYFALKYRNLILGLIFVFTAINGYFLTQLKFDFDIEQLFPIHDTDLDFYQTYTSQFRYDKSFLIVGIECDSGIFNASFLPQVDRLTKELNTSRYINSATSLTSIKYAEINRFFGTLDYAFFQPDQPATYAADSAWFYAYGDVKEKFVSSQDNAICVYLELSPELTDEDETACLAEVESILKANSFQKYHFTGHIETNHLYAAELKAEMMRLMAISLVFILIVLYATFRSVKGVLLPLVIILITGIWTLGTMSAFGITINTLTVIIPTIILIVALSDVIHLMSRFDEQLTAKISKDLAIKLAIKDIGMALFLTSVTTAMGFLTLTYSDIRPFIEFGIFTALGVMYAYLLAIILLPILLSSSEILPVSRKKEVGKKAWMKYLYDWIQARPITVILIAGIFTLVAGYGLSQIRVDSKLYDEISSGDTYSESLNFFDKHFSGIRPVQVYLEIKNPTETLFDHPHLAKIDSLEKYLLETYGVNSVYTLATQVKRLNRALHNGNPEYFRLPKNLRMSRQIRNMLDTTYQKVELNSILSPDYGGTLIEGKINDLGSHQIRLKNEKMNVFLASLFPPDQYLVRITGKALLLDKSNEIITRNLGYGLLIAILIVAMLMGIIFRSIRMAFIALIPNVLPLLWVAGLMGILGIGLKMSTAVIFTIAFGIAVDDTIHFLSRLKFEWERSSDMEEAIKETYFSTGKAIVVTSVILILGFGVLMFSAFTTTFTTGLFISITLLFAVFSDLLLLPILISLLWKNKRRAKTVSH